MSRPKLSLPTRYAAAVATVALALGINLFLAGLEQTPSAVFLAAVALSAWYLGLGPGLVSMALSAIALDYFFLPNLYSLNFGPATWVWLATYVGTAVLINALHEAQRRFILALRDNDRQKSEFMTELAHELRNFISPISHAVATLEQCGRGDPVFNQACATAERQIHSMTRLINDLLEAARITQGKVRLHLGPADLAAIVAGAVESARPMIDEKGHRFEMSLPPGPLPVQADAVRLQEVFLNLLTNAAKYTARGGADLVDRRTPGRTVGDSCAG
jgi:signal transduction histidine kinase